MASSYSTDLKLELMVTGENAGTWGDNTNNNLNLIQQAIAGFEAVALNNGGAVTLVMTDKTISNARNMESMFQGCENFNQPLNNWDVSNVTDMQRMFYGCEEFNQSLNNWDVSNVTSMQGMFHRCEEFNQPLNNWDVSDVKSMYSMFCHCSNFNQPLNKWDVSNVDDMTNLFRDCKNFNQDLNDWNVDPNTTQMYRIFYDATIFPYHEKAKWYDWVNNVDDFSDY